MNNNINFITSEAQIADVIERFNLPHTSFANRAKRWIISGLRKIGQRKLFTPDTCEIKFDEYSTPLPCMFESIIGIEVNGHELTMSNAVSYASDKYIWDYLGRRYQLFPDRVELPIKTGCVKIHFTRLVTNKKGDILIPDNEYVVEYLSYYLLNRLTLRGFKHPVLAPKDIYELMEDSLPKAQNSLSFDWETLKKIKRNLDIITFDNEMVGRHFNTNY